MGRAVTFISEIPHPAPSAPAPSISSPPLIEKPKTERPRSRRAALPAPVTGPIERPSAIPVPIAAPSEAVARAVEPALSGDPDGASQGGSSEGGSSEGGAPAGIAAVGSGAGGGGGATTERSEVLAFGEGMTRPELLSGEDPSYTREAIEARVQGTVIVKCTITLDGRLTSCRVVKAVPHMQEAVLAALATRRYRPVTFQGQPVTVDYVFTIKLVLPTR
ncbi:MAG: energy transducer TonB [Deltaproteobacteria bacterium]|nr:energy transducer TonB [Deltaproteobacteria bacterium]